MGANPQIAAAVEAKKAAYDLILGPGKEVFDLSKEKPELRDRYGRHTFGQECLVARRWSRRASRTSSSTIPAAGTRIRITSR